MKDDYSLLLVIHETDQEARRLEFFVRGVRGLIFPPAARRPAFMQNGKADGVSRARGLSRLAHRSGTVGIGRCLVRLAFIQLGHKRIAIINGSSFTIA